MGMTMMDRRTFLAAGASIPFLDPMTPYAESRSLAIRPPDNRFLESLPGLMELATLPGLAMAVVQPGKPLWQYSRGQINTRTHLPVTPNSLFPGCSLGKPMFATLVLRLAQDGVLDLDRPMNSSLKDDMLTGEWGDRVTPRHVLSHTTGLPNWRGEEDQKLTPGFEPGTRFNYSGEGFFHLERVVEHLTGQGFESLMRERIFKPWGMDSTTYLWLEDAKDRLVAGHRGLDPFYNRDLAIAVFKMIQKSDHPLSFWTYEEISSELIKQSIRKTPPQANEFVPNVAFSLLTTVSDYARFLKALIDPHDSALGLSAATRIRMISPVSRVNSALSWGMGIGLEEANGQRYLWQWGDNGGWKNFVLAHPPTNTAIAVFTNGSNGQRVNERVLRAATGIDHPAFLWI
jgi:CubicO group peptidase (beta-lactamase class C family)